MEERGLAKLYVSALFKGEGLAAPFVEGVHAAIKAENMLSGASKEAERFD